MSNCEDCVNCKWYIHKEKGLTAFCTGVYVMHKGIKKSEWIDNLNKADECDYYDEDGWTK